MLRRNAPAYTMPLCDSAEPLHSVFWPNVAHPRQSHAKTRPRGGLSQLAPTAGSRRGRFDGLDFCRA